MAYVKNINGYDIKDEEARNSIQALEQTAMNRGILQKTITPVIVGETSDVRQLGCCLVRGNRCYTVSADNYDGQGRVELWDTANNSILWRKTKTVGHGNSICFNENDGYIYLVPMYTYVGGSTTPLQAVYKFSTDFETVSSVSVPTTGTPYMISFDHETNKMYVGVWSGTNVILYLYENNAFTEFNTYDLSCIRNNSVTMQDMAINDNVMYISTINRQIILIDMISGDVIDTYTADKHDAVGKYILGELEGFEFGNDDVLYAMNTWYYSADYESNNSAQTQLGLYHGTCGVITALNSDKYIRCNAMGNFAPHNQIALKSANKDKFYLGITEIKGIEFLQNYIVDCTYITIDDGSWSYPSLYLTKRQLYIHIKVGATLTIGKWWVYSDSFTLRNNGTLTFGYRTYYSSAPFDISSSTTTMRFLVPANSSPDPDPVTNLPTGNLIETAYTRNMVITGALTTIGTIQVQGHTVNPYALTLNGVEVWHE